MNPRMHPDLRLARPNLDSKDGQHFLPTLQTNPFSVGYSFVDEIRKSPPLRTCNIFVDINFRLCELACSNCTVLPRRLYYLLQAAFISSNRQLMIGQ